MPRNADELVELLDLETIDDDLFRGAADADDPADRVRRPGRRAGAGRGVPHRGPREFAVHSLHSYFLQPGDPTVPTIYDVENLRDGRSFLTRRVIAQQHGRPIYAQTLNFHVDETGLEHQEAMPDVPSPEDSPAGCAGGAIDEEHADQWDVAEIRRIERPGGRPDAPGPAAGLAAGVLGAARRPVLAHGRVHLPLAT